MRHISYSPRLRDTYSIVSALTALLAMAAFCSMPYLNGLFTWLMPPAIPLRVIVIMRTLRIIAMHRHTSSGVLLIGALSNAGGIAFHA